MQQARQAAADIRISTVSLPRFVDRSEDSPEGFRLRSDRNVVVAVVIMNDKHAARFQSARNLAEHRGWTPHKAKHPASIRAVKTGLANGQTLDAAEGGADIRQTAALGQAFE